jgi:hypothetical protein
LIMSTSLINVVALLLLLPESVASDSINVFKTLQ